MADIDRLIAALRCSANPKCSEENCFFCEYAKKEDVEKLGLMAVEIAAYTDCLQEGGKKYYVSCDCDRMCIDAANMLEDLKTEIENLIEIREE